jgi:hypothetical protein
MNAEAPKTPLSWFDELLLATLRQGPAFFTLAVLLCGAWQLGDYLVTRGIPAHLEQIKDGYREISQRQREDLQRVIDAFQHEADRFDKVLDVLEPVVQNRELIQENQKLIQQTLDELRDLRARSPQPEKS